MRGVDLTLLINIISQQIKITFLEGRGDVGVDEK